MALNWNELKHIKVEKAKPYVLSFKTEYDGPWQAINLLQTGRKRVSSIEVDTLQAPKVAYKKTFPVPAEKYDDLQWMCQHKLIPNRYHQFYNAIESEKRETTKPSNVE